QKRRAYASIDARDRVVVVGRRHGQRRCLLRSAGTEGGAMKRIKAGAIGAALWLAAGIAFGADLDAAKKKVSEICQACHGMDGNSQVPDYPKLAGQNQDYVAKALRDYKSGARKDPTMSGFATPLTTQEIDNLAAYFSAQPAVLESRM